MMNFVIALVSATPVGGGGGGGDPDPPGAPTDLVAANNGVNYSIAWIDAASQQVEVYRDGSLFSTVNAGVQIVAVGPMAGDGTHTWKARHIGPEGPFSTEITTIDGVVGGGGGPSGVPSSLDAYEYASGSKYGISCVLGDVTAETELEEYDVQVGGTLLETHVMEPGVSTHDIGLKSSGGIRGWQARHKKNSIYSAFSAAIQTINGVVV